MIPYYVIHKRGEEPNALAPPYYYSMQCVEIIRQLGPDYVFSIIR